MKIWARNPLQKIGEMQDEVKAKLEHVGQHVKYQLELGTDPNEIMTSPDAISSQLGKGFRVTQRHCFVKNLEKLLLHDDVEEDLKKLFFSLSPFASISC